MTNKDYQYIFWDFDGTLVDTLVATGKAAKYALEYFNIKIDDEGSLRENFSGPPLRETFAKYNLNENDISKAIELYRKFQNESGITCNTKYNGIENVLETLKNQNKKLIVVTGKQEEIAKKILQYENLDKYFDYIIGATKDNSRVLKTEIVEYAMNFIENIDFNKCIIVGDSSSDIKTGINYNMDSIGVTYGPGDKEKLKNAGATYLVDEVEKLLEILD